MLRAAAAVVTGSLLAGCGLDQVGAARLLTTGNEPAGEQAQDLTGAFSWRRHAGSTLRLLLVDHPYSSAMTAQIGRFELLTGQHVQCDVVPESRYFESLTASLSGQGPAYDGFMTGTPMIWQYATPGWLEDLRPWLSSSSATAADYDVADIHPQLLAATQWARQDGSPLGSGGQWAMPFGHESHVLTYDAGAFRRLGLRAPTNLDELEDVSQAYQRGARRHGRPRSYGLAVRGATTWASAHGGILSQLVREGAHDFTVRDGAVVPDLASPTSVAFHEQWTRMLRDSGSPDWMTATHLNCLTDLRAAHAGMVYDSGAMTLSARRDLGWAPGPAGRGGALDTSLWVWSLAISAGSTRKSQAWQWVQWATGREHLLRAALYGHHHDPVRASIADDPAYRQLLSGRTGYLQTQDAVRDAVAVLSTPQQHYFDVSARWASAVRDIYRGEPADTRLADLDRALSARV